MFLSYVGTFFVLSVNIILLFPQWACFCPGWTISCLLICILSSKRSAVSGHYFVPWTSSAPWSIFVLLNICCLLVSLLSHELHMYCSILICLFSYELHIYSCLLICLLSYELHMYCSLLVCLLSYELHMYCSLLDLTFVLWTLLLSFDLSFVPWTICSLELSFFLWTTCLVLICSLSYDLSDLYWSTFCPLHYLACLDLSLSFALSDLYWSTFCPLPCFDLYFVLWIIWILLIYLLSSALPTLSWYVFCLLNYMLYIYIPFVLSTRYLFWSQELSFAYELHIRICSTHNFFSSSKITLHCIS